MPSGWPHLGIDVVLTREPGGSPFAEALRTLILDPETPPHSALSEALLFYAARADHLEKTIRPALNAGRWVICDRFSDSTRVYQSEAGGLPGEVFDALEEMVVAPTTPDLTLILDLPAELGLGRAQGRRLVAPERGTRARRLREARPRLSLEAARGVHGDRPMPSPTAACSSTRPRRKGRWQRPSGRAVEARLLAEAR